MKAITLITVPGSVWYDALDPLATAMQADLGLDHPTWRRIGRGSQARYHGVPVNVARELAKYLDDRAETMLAQDTDPDEHGVLYAMRRTATKILEDVRKLELPQT